MLFYFLGGEETIFGAFKLKFILDCIEKWFFT